MQSKIRSRRRITYSIATDARLSISRPTVTCYCPVCIWAGTTFKLAKASNGIWILITILSWGCHLTSVTLETRVVAIRFRKKTSWWVVLNSGGGWRGCVIRYTKYFCCFAALGHNINCIKFMSKFCIIGSFTSSRSNLIITNWVECTLI